jgi:hypothetical protein
VSIHPVKRLTAPDGHRAHIDVMLVPLIKALWRAGYETVSCCQDLGESLAHVERFGAFWDGYASVDMPVEDALRLLRIAVCTDEFAERLHWAAPEGWQVSMPVIPRIYDGESDFSMLVPWIQIRFPNKQIDELITVIKKEAKP